MTELDDWFVCTNCGEEDRISVSMCLGFGNMSLSIRCDMCGFKHKERDPESSNWKTSIDIKHYLTGRNLRSPSASRTGKKLAQCPSCGEENVDFWIYSDNSGLDNRETVGYVRFNCTSCSANMKKSIEHN